MLTRLSRLFLQRLLLVLCALSCSPIALSEQTWTVNFKETDIHELIRFVAKTTDRTIIIDPKVKGRVNVISSKPVNREELYQLFLSILEVQGFTAVQSGGVVRVVPGKDARTSPVPVSSSAIDEADTSSEVITQVIQLENISAAKLIPVLRPLAPQQAHMAAYAPSNAIIISDTRANIARIRAVINSIDQSALEKTDVIKLEHASAEDVVQMLQQLQKSDAAKGKADNKSLTLVADSRTNSVLVNGDELSRQRVHAMIRYLDTPLTQSGNVRVVYLQYGDAKDIAATLTKVVQNIEKMSSKSPQAKGASSRGGGASIEADEDTNALIIIADADDMQSIMSVVDRLDIRRAQVLIEAIIVEMQDVDGRSLGLQWLFLNDNGVYGSSSTGDGSLGAFGSAISDSDGEGNNDQLGLVSVLAGTAGQLLGVGQVDDNLSFNVVINALNNDVNANILSTPSLLTMDNQEASIVVGQNIPIVTGSYSSTGDGSSPNNPFQTIERENVGISLVVTPHINDGDSLVLEIVQEVSSLTGAAEEVNASDLITNERRIETKVLAENGQTIVLGGLIKDEVQSVQQKIPLLGDIPWLGRLFRNDSTKVTKTHLMVFIRSTIIRSSQALNGATAEKYKYIYDIQQAKIDNGMNLIDDGQMPILPEWQQQLESITREHQEGAIDLKQEMAEQFPQPELDNAELEKIELEDIEAGN